MQHCGKNIAAASAGMPYPMGEVLSTSIRNSDVGTKNSLSDKPSSVFLTGRLNASVNNRPALSSATRTPPWPTNSRKRFDSRLSYTALILRRIGTHLTRIPERTGCELSCFDHHWILIGEYDDVEIPAQVASDILVVQSRERNAEIIEHEPGSSPHPCCRSA